MIYKQLCGEKLSSLGLGTMRLPVVAGDNSKIDEKQTAEMIDYALKNGINYFDTAFGYHSGNSEIVVGNCLSAYDRDSFRLASKFPGFNEDNMKNVSGIFERQLQKCRVDHFDFYLFHNVCEMNIDWYLDKKYGLYDYLMEQKKNGRIRHLGFSVHGNYNTFMRLLNAYGNDIEFCQIQLNYLDWDFQEAKLKVEELRKRNIPVWVMEPLRGGKLARLSPEAEAKLKAARPDEAIPAWAFRYLQSIQGIGVVLSGMSNMEQLKANIETFGKDLPLNENEWKLLNDISAKMLSNTLPCTGCRYCVDYCPQGLNIPSLISLYNEHSFTGGGFIAPMALSSFAEDKRPDSCLGCRSCESVCPQNIKISEMMKDFVSRLKD